MVVCETTSNREPVAISTNRAKSVRDARELPSARFDENRNGCAPHLIRQSEALFARKVAGQFIHQISKLNCFLPDIEFFKVKHSAVISPSTLNYQLPTLNTRIVRSGWNNAFVESRRGRDRAVSVCFDGPRRIKFEGVKSILFPLSTSSSRIRSKNYGFKDAIFGSTSR